MRESLKKNAYPAADNDYLYDHVRHLWQSFQYWTGKSLSPDMPADPKERARWLFEAPFALLSHGSERDPIFNYANRTGLGLFALSWEDLIILPSRYSAEPVNREERARLLAEVTEKGYIAHYSGVRTAKTGQRFRIDDAIVWNLLDDQGKYYGQAAFFKKWEF